MIDNLKSAASLFLRILVVMLMSLLVTMSVSLLCNAAFTEPIGYNAIGVKEGSSEEVTLYTHYYNDGEDTNAEVYQNQGYRITKQTIRSELKGIGNTVFAVVSQGISIIILCAFIYSLLWKKGNKDHAHVKINKAKEDKLKGLKIGLIASVPSFGVLLWLFICGIGANPDASTSLYKLMSYHFYIFDTAIIGFSKTAGDLAFWKYLILLLPLMIVPVMSEIAYIIGYKDISLSEKIIYKNANKQQE